MKQLSLLSLPRPTLREYIQEQLRDFKLRQEGRAMKRKQARERRKRGPVPESQQEEMFPPAWQREFGLPGEPDPMAKDPEAPCE